MWVCGGQGSSFITVLFLFVEPCEDGGGAASLGESLRCELARSGADERRTTWQRLAERLRPTEWTTLATNPPPIATSTRRHNIAMRTRRAEARAALHEAAGTGVLATACATLCPRRRPLGRRRPRDVPAAAPRATLAHGRPVRSAAV